VTEWTNEPTEMVPVRSVASRFSATVYWTSPSPVPVATSRVIQSTPFSTTALHGQVSPFIVTANAPLPPADSNAASAGSMPTTMQGTAA
jgi:hypothetical protein